ncbi:hypothetical protein BDD12DRAFT_897707 [Trichophaea hybrida]|nr:hypothetical protein BDD12DRAFT_897707 [Trichophaea hybrida]
MTDDEDEQRKEYPPYYPPGKSALVSHGRFIDPKEEAIEARPFSTTAPNWRHAGQGVNLEGHCKNTACVSHKQGRIIHIWGQRNFNFFDEEHLCACPMCHKYVQPISCGFDNTQWKISGIKKVGRGSPPEKVPGQWHTAAKKDGYITFDDNLTEQVHWKELLIEVR